MPSPLAILKLAAASIKLFRDPKRLDEVIDIADSIMDPKLVQPMVDAAKRDALGARAFAERPRVRFDLKELKRLPEGTLGREFADHMERAGLDPNDLPTRPAPD